MSKARRLLSMFVELDQPAPPPELPARASAPWTMATEASPPSPARNPAELPLSDVYQAAGVSGETAPKVQRILDGLGVLAPDSRRAAVLALASADGSWSVEGVAREVEQRVQALEGYMGLLNEHAKAEEGVIKARLAEAVEASQIEVQEIDAQMAALAARRTTAQETLVALRRDADRAVREVLTQCTTVAESAADARRRLKELVAFLVGPAGPTKG